MDIENISRHICINDMSYVYIEFVKFRNSLGEAILADIQHDDENRLCVIGDCYTVIKIDDYIDIEITEYTSKGLIPVFKYTQKIVREQYKIGMLESLNNIKQTRFDKLDLKIINFDAIKMCPRRFGFYELSFTTFVNEKKQEIKIIPDENKNQSESMMVEYEAIIIVQISSMRDKFHHITKYPVSDADGQYPITNYDTEDNYYQGLRLQHDKLQMMLDIVYDIYLNDCIIDDQKSIMLNLLLDIDEKHSLGYYKMTHEIELEDTNIPCHQQNIEFIKNLQSNFGENINIQLYNVERDKKFSIELIRYKTYCDFIDLYSYKNKMDIDTYLKEKDYNANRGVLMILNIKNTKEEDSTYYFINHKYINNEIRNRLIKYISENNEPAFTELKTRTLKHLKNIYEKKNDMDNNPNTKALYKHLKNMVSVIIKHIENDYCNFLLKYDYNYCQKLLLRIKTEPIDLSKEDFVIKNFLRHIGFFANNENRQNIPNVNFILDKDAQFNKINEFIDILLEPKIKLITNIINNCYSDLLENMRKILIDEILEENNIRIERNRKIYLQAKQITARQDDFDKLNNCISETFKKKRKDGKLR
ncbi:hypothetical protein BDAP_000456 [Binucleata daphniae]